MHIDFFTLSNNVNSDQSVEQKITKKEGISFMDVSTKYHVLCFTVLQHIKIENATQRRMHFWLTEETTKYSLPSSRQRSKQLTTIDRRKLNSADERRRTKLFVRAFNYGFYTVTAKRVHGENKQSNNCISGSASSSHQVKLRSIYSSRGRKRERKTERQKMH